MEVEHWASVRESAASALGLGLKDAFTLLHKVKECEQSVTVANFKVASLAIHGFRTTMKIVKPVQDFIKECPLAANFVCAFHIEKLGGCKFFKVLCGFGLLFPNH